VSKCYVCRDFHGAIYRAHFEGYVGQNIPKERKIYIELGTTNRRGELVRVCRPCLKKLLLRCFQGLETRGDVTSTAEVEFVPI
jgi:hypothetical protein